MRSASGSRSRTSSPLAPLLVSGGDEMKRAKANAAKLQKDIADGEAEAARKAVQVGTSQQQPPLSGCTFNAACHEPQDTSGPASVCCCSPVTMLCPFVDQFIACQKACQRKGSGFVLVPGIQMMGWAQLNWYSLGCFFCAMEPGLAGHSCAMAHAGQCAAWSCRWAPTRSTVRSCTRSVSRTVSAQVAGAHKKCAKH